MKASEDAYDLIKCFEGFVPRAYWCPGRRLTVGYGTTSGVYLGQVVTHAEAIALLKKDVHLVQGVIGVQVTVPLNQHQYDALVSFVYNIGVGAFSKSTLLRKLNAGDYLAVPNEMRRWVRGGPLKLKLKGLVNRREAEIALFLKQSNEVQH